MRFPAAALLLIACNQPQSIEMVDREYSQLMRGLAAAERDNTKNFKDSEAQARKTRLEQERIAFFTNEVNTEVIEGAVDSSDPFTAARGAAYQLDALIHRSWTDEEKEQEQELLGTLQRLRQNEVVWASADGEVEVALNRSWSSVARDAAGLDSEQADELLTAWVDARTAWMGDELTELVRLRNEVARREGFETYWELAVVHRGLTVERIEEMDRALTEMVAPMNQRRSAELASLAEGLGLENNFYNTPAISDASEQWPTNLEMNAAYDADLVETRMFTAMREMGISLDGLQIYTGPTRYTRPGAYGYAISPPEDFAIVMSRDSRWSAWAYSALAHEMGLAFWWKSLPERAATSPVMWEPPSPWFEGIGQLFERLAMSEDFARNYIEGFPGEIAVTLDAHHKAEAAEEITFYLGASQMERYIYEHPGQWSAVATEAASLEAQLNGFTWESPTSSEGVPYSGLLQSGLMLHYPGYIQNYLFASATEQTLFKVITEAVGEPVGNHMVGPWLREHLVGPVSRGQSFPAVLAELAEEESPIAALAEWFAAE